MLISDLKNKIVTGDLEHFYIFTGPEEGIMDIYIKQIAKKLNLTIKWADSVEQVCKLVNLKSLVGGAYLYLVRLDSAFKSQDNLWQRALEFTGNYVILIQPDIDKRAAKFVKFFDERTIKFERLSNDMLLSYAKKLCPTLDKSSTLKLIEWCGSSFSRFMNELDKIKTLSIVRNIDNSESFHILDNENGIYKEQDFDIFKYTDKILARDVFGSYELLEKAKSQNCDVLVVGLLGASFKNMVLLKNDGGGAGVVERTGLTNWQIKCANDFDKYYNVDECEKNVLLLQDSDVKIKTGVLNSEYTLGYLLAEIL